MSGAQGWGGVDVAATGSGLGTALAEAEAELGELPLAQATVVVTLAARSKAKQGLNHRGRGERGGAQGKAETILVIAAGFVFIVSGDFNS